MPLTQGQAARAAGVLLGTAVGDALGVHYEFSRPPGPDEPVEMLGGGLIDGAPGEWSDDTSMAIAIALATAEQHDLGSPEGRRAVARRFLHWYDGEPPDIGNQTRAVLAAVAPHREDPALGDLMTRASQDFARQHEHAAGNGALMRTAVVALASPTDRDRTARAARAVAMLTHADPLAVESCVIWTEAVRLAVLDARVDVRAGLDLLPPHRRAVWEQHLDAVPAMSGSSLRPNGFTVTALQAATAAVTRTPVPADDPAAHFGLAVADAVRIGDDTDTVAAIAGGLLGARWGTEAVPARWRDLVHGWPGMRAGDLDRLSAAIVGPYR